MNKPLDGQTDRQAKSSRWAFTAYEAQWHLFDDESRRNHPGIAKVGWNSEICPETNRKHYQGYIQLKQTQRLSWLLKIFPAVHMEIARNWQALIAYCEKEDTRIPGTTPVHHTNSIPNHYQYADDVGKRVCEYMLRENISFNSSYEKYMEIIDDHVKNDVSSGKRYAAHIGANPAWAAMWKKYAKQFIFSFSVIDNATKEESRSEEAEEEVPGKGTIQQSGSSDNQSG